LTKTNQSLKGLSDKEIKFNDLDTPGS